MIGRVIAYVVGRPWAVLPEIAELMVEVLSRRSVGERLSREELDARTGRHDPEAGPVRRHEARASEAGAVAVMQVFGLVAHRARAVQDVSSPASTSAELLAAQIRAAVADPQIGSIVLDIDSPGGSVEGVPELAAEIRQARASKRIVAVANGLAASAAYWIASQADEVVVTPSGQVGSIGVYVMHEDASKRLEAEGRKFTLISAGKFKVEGNPLEPLGDEAHAALKGKVDAYYGMFVADVAKGRGVPVAEVRKGYGEGRTLIAADAVAAGMADRVDTLDRVLERLAAGKLPEPRKGARADQGIEVDDRAADPVAEERRLEDAPPVLEAAPVPLADPDLDLRRRRLSGLARRQN